MAGRCASGILAAALVVYASPVAAQPYTVVPIEAVDGYRDWVVPTDINNRLQVVGYARGAAGSSAFIWDLVNGFRLLPVLETGSTMAPWIDDAGAVYGWREVGGRRQLTKVIGDEVRDLPMPADDTVTWIGDVTNNGIVLMHGAHSWVLAGETLYDVTAITGASVYSVNEQGMLGGCKNGQGYVRTPDGREFVPWATARCVSVIGAAGHFATSQVWDYNPTFKENPAYYGTPDGRTWRIAFYSPPFVRVTDMNAAGTFVGWQHSSLGSDEMPFVETAAGGRSYLNSVTQSSSWTAQIAHAINDAGYIVASGYSGAALLVPTAPLAPSGLTFTVDGNTVHLAWQRAAGAIDYIVEAGSVPGSSDLFTGSVGNVIAIDATVASARYYVRVRGRTAAGVLTDPSAEVVIDVGSGAPTPPSGLTSSVTGNLVTVQWQASTGAVDYIVEAGNDAGTSNFFSGSVGAQTRVTATVPTGRYYVRVRARTASGFVTLPSEELVIDVAPAGVPPAPTGLHLIATKIVGELEWNPSPGAVDYIVEAGSAPGASDLTTIVTAEPRLGATKPAPGRYYIRVRARNAAGVSAPSNELVVEVH